MSPRNVEAERTYRAAHPEYVERNRRRSRARREALEALAREHPTEFTTLYETALERHGIRAEAP